MRGKCEICGEQYDTVDRRNSRSDIGEFYDPETDGHVIAHAECGLNKGLEMA